MSGSRTLVTALLGWALLALLLVLDWHFFPQLTGVPFFKWFRESTGKAYLGFAVVAWAIDLDRSPDLVSRHPLEFLRAYILGVAYVFAQWSTFFSLRRKPSSLPSDVADLVDKLATSLIGLGLILALLAWLLLIAPAQYVVYLLAGAPARAMMRSRERIIVKKDGARTILTITDQESAGEDEETLRRRPVTLTNALSPAILWLLGFV